MSQFNLQHSICFLFYIIFSSDQLQRRTYNVNCIRLQWENWELMNLTKELEIGCTNLLLFILCNIKIITLVHYIGFPIEFKHFVALSRRVKLKQPIQLENLVYPHLSLTKRYIPLLKLFFQISHNQRYVCTFKTVDKISIIL